MTDPLIPPPAAPRWMRVGLVLSLALNLLILSLIAGLILSGRGPAGAPRGVEFASGPMLEALDFADRRAVGRALRESGEARRIGREARQAMLGEMAALIRAEPFDPAALEALLETQAERGRRLQTLARAAYLARLEDLTPEARNAYADRLEELSRRSRAPAG